MKKFEFKFHSLLKHRKTVEEQRQGEYATEYRVMQSEEEKLEKMQTHLNQIKNQYKFTPGQKIDLHQRDLVALYMRRATALIAQQEVTIDDIRVSVEEKRTRLTEALKERKVMEKLKERDLRTYATDLLRKEQNSLDEIVVQRVAQKL